MIDIANQYAVKIDYQKDGKLLETMILFSPDIKIIKNIRIKYENTGFSKEIENIIENDQTEISYIQINYLKHEIFAFRSITSHYELFYYEQKILEKGYEVERDIIITDHIINMLSYLPVSKRSLCIEGICDVFLYQHSYGKETYIKNIYRLGHGELLSYQENKISVQIVQTLELGKYDLKKEQGADVLENSLREACQKMQKKESINQEE